MTRPITTGRRPLAAHLLAASLLLCGMAATPALAQSNDPTFDLINRGSVIINEVYVSSSAQAAWGPDLLGANVLQPGQRLRINLPDGQCINDVRVVFANGSATERRQQNTCAITEMMFP